MKLASMANYQKDGIIAVEYDTQTETGSAYTIIDGVKEDLPAGPVQHNAAGHLATEANYGGDLVSAQYDKTSGTGAASATVGGVEIEIGGGGGQAENGLLSVSASPAITASPTLDTISIDYDDVASAPDEYGQKSVKQYIAATGTPSSTYVLTVTPTSEWYAEGDDGLGAKGEPVPVTAYTNASGGFGTVSLYLYNYDYTQYDNPPESAKSLYVELNILAALEGLLSITISPTLTTNPALDSLFPVYIGDARIDEGTADLGEVTSADELSGDYSVTLTPTANVYIMNDYDDQVPGKGEPLTVTS